MPKKKTALTIEERLQQALVPAEEQPYEVPENWVWVRLGSLAQDMADGPFGSNLKTEHYTNNKEVRIIQLSNIGENGWREDNKKYTTFEHAKVIARSKVEAGDIVIAKMMPAGRAIICPSYEQQYVLSSDAVKFVPNSLVDNNFCCKGINSHFFQTLVQENTQGITRARTSIKKLKGYPFPLPPLSEQQRIVERIEELFAKLDEAKERLQEVADSFAVRKAAILHKAFTGELTKQWRRENGVRDESWEEKKLSEITENQDSKRIPLSKSQRDNMNRIYDYYGASGIIDKVDDYIFEGKKLLIGEDGANLVTRSKDIAFIADGKYWVNNHAHILDVKDTVLLMYLCNYINNMDLIPYVTGSAQPKLTQAKMNNIKIFLPTLPEQHEIVRLIDDLLARERAAQQAAEQALASIDLMKKSILARAFRGELGTNKASEASALELLRQVLS
ncbi:restriction endonuclease subunit S [Phascolarctobacterium succinatutens]|jgi:type I restriction enzyme S subunit|uniref:restriction endonuclease subunit S n=1 Tax=Phascolarctobacterium succinatutens TaxID=626940 RepID=UPI00265F17EF|nr:restriction endonuclease subunit S [Phascolarctobacterium succinatutens]